MVAHKNSRARHPQYGPLSPLLWTRTFLNNYRNHILKIENVHLIAILSGNKKAEIRKNDRNYKVGDNLIFRFNDDNLNFIFRITHVLNAPDYLKEGYVYLSIERIK